ncbi:MAG TPA: DUF1206 domain-containing protein [Actinomycetales bacterium]|nr:DUF1206 domain-containing protein [Actinomycetales bacterium]
MTERALTAAKKAQHSDLMTAFARLGFVVTGALFLLLGWIAARIALGGSNAGPNADQSGALAQLASAPGGPVLLWLTVIGFAALGLWHLLQGLSRLRVRPDGRRGGWSDAWKPVATGVVYIVLAYTATTFASGAGHSSKEQTRDISAVLMAHPLGKVALVVAGVVILVVAAYHVYKGVTQNFTQDLRGPGDNGVGAAVRTLGVVGYVAKGVAFAIVGVLVIVGVLNSNPAKASGLDEALRTLRAEPFGTALLLAVAVGFACYGMYMFARARYSRF